MCSCTQYHIKMQYLPVDLITYIGRWIPNEVCKAMLGAAKTFSGICSGHEEHTIVVEQQNVKKMKRMQKTIAYIRKIKPRVKTIKIKFVNIYDLPIWDEHHQKLSSKDVWITFEVCSIRIMSDVIKWFEPGFKCNIKRSSCFEPYNECHLYSEVNNINHVTTYIHSQSQISQVLQHPVVCNAKEVYLCMGNYHTPLVIDMSRVNEENNNVLAFILNQKCDVVCLNAHKLTCIHWMFFDEMRYYTYEGLDVEASIVNNPQIQSGKARLQHVIVSSCHTFTRHDRFLNLGKALLPCKNVKYYVDVNCPDMIVLIYEMLDLGINKNNILYYCVDGTNKKTRWVTAQYCKIVFPDLNLDLQDIDTPLDLVHLKTEHEFYNAMPDRDRQIWGSVHFSRKSFV